MALRFLRLIVVLSACSLCAAVPSVPPPVGKNALDLQATADAAISASQATLHIPRGQYVFSNNNLLIQGARDMVIEAQGVSLIFYYGFGLKIEQCHNITVRGLTLDADPPNYAQGVVVDSADNMSFVARFDDQFIPPDTKVQPFSNPGGLAGAKMAFWDPMSRRVLHPGAVDFLAGSEPLADGLWHISMARPSGKDVLLAGTMVTIFPRRGITWLAENSSLVTAEDISIYAGGNMGFVERDGEGGHVYRRVAIVRKPGSTGLMALNADGFHSDSVGKGATIEDSEISFTGDDIFNTHTEAFVVCKTLHEANDRASSLLVVDRTHAGTLSELRIGDELSFFKLLPGRNVGHTIANPLLGSGFVSGWTRIEDPEVVKECQRIQVPMMKPPYNAQFVSNNMFAKVRVFQVDFKDLLDPTILHTDYNLAQFERRAGGNVQVHRSRFHDSCGSGGRMLLQASHLSFQHNVVERIGSVFVWSGEQIYLNGALGVHDVHFQNNTFVDSQLVINRDLSNTTCAHTTFVAHGATTHKDKGCFLSSGHSDGLLV